MTIRARTTFISSICWLIFLATTRATAFVQVRPTRPQKIDHSSAPSAPLLYAVPPFHTPNYPSKKRLESNTLLPWTTTSVSRCRSLLSSLFLSCCLCFCTYPTKAVAGTDSYWDMVTSVDPATRVQANLKLMEYVVETTHTMYYDNTGGARFQPRDFFYQFKKNYKDDTTKQSAATLASRDDTVRHLKELIQSIGDPYSMYLTRQELEQELQTSSEGFLGLGAMIEVPPDPSVSQLLGKGFPPLRIGGRSLPPQYVSTLPVITAVSPNSPAERAGLTVGDRILAINNDVLKLTGVQQHLRHYYEADNYLGHLVLTIAKPIVNAPGALLVPAAVNAVNADWISSYRQFRVKLPTTAATGEPHSLVSYQLLNDSIFSTSHPVGYIRLTRFSKAATEGFLQAVSYLETAGAESYIIDLRNNYGGVIQEAMLMASSLLRDPHAVLCYTLNSRGGVTPHDVEEFVVDHRYPGYLLSREPKDTTQTIVRSEHPEYFKSNGKDDSWSPMSSFASLKELKQTRGIHGTSTVRSLVRLQQLSAQKNLVILINEGTASSAEVFASALHDNGRLTALVGTKSFGKGLVQHTFRTPDGGGLRLTVAEYLTPSLQHVTRVGAFRLDEFGNSNSGIRPDIYCDSRFGIPRHVGADICVGVALDALEDSELSPLAALQRSGDLGI